MGKAQTNDNKGGASTTTTTTETAITVKAIGKSKTEIMDEKILGVMMKFQMENNCNVSLLDVSNVVGCHERNKPFRERWSVLKMKKEFIGPSKTGKGFQLTEEGMKLAQTDEYKEMMKELSVKSKTNKDHQERIKKYLKKPKSGVIFDFFNEFGSLTSDKLAALVGQNKRSHAFHYGLKELRDKGYVEVEEREDLTSNDKKKKFCLADKSYLNPEDRLKGDNAIDSGKLDKKVAEGIETIESQKQGPRKRKTTKAVKSVKQEDKVKEEEGGDEEDDTTSSNNEEDVSVIIESYKSSALSDGQQQQEKNLSEVKIKFSDTEAIRNNKRQRVKLE